MHGYGCRRAAVLRLQPRLRGQAVRGGAAPAGTSDGLCRRHGHVRLLSSSAALTRDYYVTGTSEGAPELLDRPAADAVARDCALRSKDCGARQSHPAQRPRVQIRLQAELLHVTGLPLRAIVDVVGAAPRPLALQIWRAVARQNYLKRTVFFFFLKYVVSIMLGVRMNPKKKLLSPKSFCPANSSPRARPRRRWTLSPRC